jgi:3'(2'), 5'-bisphosphate nucleotidase
MKVDGKTDGSPVTEADLAADRIIGEGLRGSRRHPSLSEERVASGDAALSRQLLPDRSARRHQGIRRRPQRIHRQSRAGDAGTPLLGIVGAPALG